jgi:hypothetical protein
MTTINISIDSNLQFSVGGNRIGTNDSIELAAAEGVDVTLQLLAPISFTASHDEKGKTIRWAPVTTTLASFAAQQTFPCPRSPFTLTVTATDATTGGASKATKKVRIEAVAASGQ